MDNNKRNENRGNISRENSERRISGTTGQNGRPVRDVSHLSGARHSGNMQNSGGTSHSGGTQHQSGSTGRPSQQSPSQGRAQDPALPGGAPRVNAPVGQSRDVQSGRPAQSGAPRAAQSGRPNPSGNGRTARSTDRSGRPQQGRPGGKRPMDNAARRRRRRNTVLISIAAFVAVLAVVVLVLW